MYNNTVGGDFLSEIIYVDVLVILNLFITLFLLLATELFTKEKAKRLRLFSGALAGGLYSLIVFLPEMGIILNILSRVAAGSIITYLTFGFKTLKRFLKLFATFVLLTFLFAGLMVGAWIIFKPNGMFLNNSTVYFGVSLPVLIISTAVCYFISYAVSKFSNKTKPAHTVFDFTLTAFGQTVTGRAMLDTGNTLTEPFSSYPVVVCTYEFLRDILPKENLSFFSGEIQKIDEIKNENILKKVRVISAKTVAGTHILPSFKADMLDIKNTLHTDNVFVAVTPHQKYINGSYDMLLNPNLF